MLMVRLSKGRRCGLKDDTPDASTYLDTPDASTYLTSQIVHRLAREHGLITLGAAAASPL
jgi:hypothetical protein